MFTIRGEFSTDELIGKFVEYQNPYSTLDKLTYEDGGSEYPFRLPKDTNIHYQFNLPSSNLAEEKIVDYSTKYRY